MTSQPYDVRFEERDGVVVAFVIGEIDVATAAPVLARLREATPPAGRMVVDFTAVPFADSSGIGILDRMLGHARMMSATVRFVVPETAQLRYVLRICAFPEEFLAGDLQAALVRI